MQRSQSEILLESLGYTPIGEMSVAEFQACLIEDNWTSPGQVEIFRALCLLAAESEAVKSLGNFIRSEICTLRFGV